MHINNRKKSLVFDQVAKDFGGTKALKGVSLTVQQGEVVALLGENGAGKSTLIKILGGIHTPSSGSVSIDGNAYKHVAGNTREKQAVAFIHQDLGLIEWMSVAENIAMTIGYSKRKNRIDWQATEAAADEALKLIDAQFSSASRVSNLSRTEKSLVAIARALATKCDFLVLDEPTASLPADEVERLFAALRPLRAQGVGMIYVSHRLDEIFKIADRVAVLRDGQLVGTRDIANTHSEDLVNLIVGKQTREISRPALQTGIDALSVTNFRCGTTGPIDFSVQRGEMLGLVGLRGAGHEAIGRALFGLGAHTGEVRLDGRTPDLRSPARAVASGIGFLARDRVVESVAQGLSIRENTFINPKLTGRKMLGLQGVASESEQAEQLGKKIGLSPNDSTLPIEALSGGNQQKIVVGRWLDTNRAFLIAEDPTAGVDVGAKAEIYNLLYDAMRSGMAVMVVSTDFEEIATICHRAIVFSRGKQVAELSGEQLSTHSLIQAASASEAA